MEIINKGWGQERIWCSNDEYCSKFLDFNENGKSSLHFHKDKKESWYIISGEFVIIFVDTTTGEKSMKEYKTNDILTIDRLVPHQVYCIKEGSILEVSTKDTIEDNYRIEKGDSQK